MTARLVSADSETGQLPQIVLDNLDKRTAQIASPVLNYTKQPSAKWFAAKAKADAGTGHAKLLVVGDSKSWGYPEGMATSWPTTMLSRAFSGSRTQPGASIPGVRSALDPRWAVPTNWETVFGPGSGALYANPGTGASAIYTPGVIVDTIDVWWYKALNKGAFVVSIDGVAKTAIDTNSTDGSGGWRKTTYTVTAAANHVVSFAPPTTNPVSVFVDAYLDTSKSVRLANWGVIGSTTGTWADGPYSTDAITAWAPDLTLIMLGTNDGGNSVPASTWSANVGKLIDAAKVTGDVVLLSCIPSQSATNLAGETAYRDAAPALAASKDIPFIDVFSKVGPWDTNLFADNLHPNARGYGWTARTVAAGLRSL